MKVISVNISKEKGTVKKPVDTITINDNGIIGDAHSGTWHRQITLLAIEDIETFSHKNNRTIKWGEFAENLTTQDIDLGKVAVFDRLQINDVELEVTQIGKECHGGACAIFREVGKCIMPKQGIFCRVIKGGTIKANDTIKHIKTPFNINIITMSDRASRGEYEDKSGPLAEKLLSESFTSLRWHIHCEREILADDKKLLSQALKKARDNQTSVVIVTGGTGIGPRDITPEVVIDLSDKTIPGIMEHIRTKYGSQKPNALISRSVAAVMDQTLVYALPGSVKAVKEYLDEITPTIAHSIFMLKGIDTH